MEKKVHGSIKQKVLKIIFLYYSGRLVQNNSYFYLETIRQWCLDK